MAFSLPQILKYLNPMVDEAWRVYCDRECITDSTQVSKKAWYRQELLKCIGKKSSSGCNKGKDFDKVMAWFEDLADAGVYWQSRVLQGDARRARHLLDETIKNLHLTEDYVTAVALQAGFRDGLKQYTAEQLLKLRLMLLYPVRRGQKRYLNSPPERAAAPPE